MTRTVPAEETIILKDIKHSTHLTEDENSGTLCVHRFQQLVENDQFTRVLDEMFICGVGRTRFLKPFVSESNLKTRILNVLLHQRGKDGK